ncbi:ankyrin repeat-containing domain protein [Trichoderma compactum]
MKLTAWVKHHLNYQRWVRESISAALVIIAPPGSGETALTSLILHRANNPQDGCERATVLSFVFHSGDINCNSERSFLVSMLRQLLLDSARYHHISTIAEFLVGQHCISLEQFWVILCLLLEVSGTSEIFIIAHAVEQCMQTLPESHNFQSKLLGLITAAQLRNKRLKILLTTSCETLDPAAQCIPSIKFTDESGWTDTVTEVVSERLSRMVHTGPLWRPFREQITKQLCDGQNSFDDIELHLNLLEHRKVESNRAALLSHLYMPILSTKFAFDTLLSGLDKNSLEVHALNWIFHATRPLTVSELSVALTLTYNLRTLPSNSDILPKSAFQMAVSEAAKNTILDTVPEPYTWESLEHLADYVYWNLYSDLREILCTVIVVVGDQVVPVHRDFGIYFRQNAKLLIQSFHHLVARQCLHYVSLIAPDKVDDADNPSDPTIGGASVGGEPKHNRTTAFLDYATWNWSKHYRLALIEDPQISPKPFADFLGHGNVLKLLSTVRDIEVQDPAVLAAYQGLALLTKALLLTPGCSSAPQIRIRAAAEAAAEQGETEVLEVLLPTCDSRTLISVLRRAARYGRNDVLDLIFNYQLPSDLNSTLTTSGNLALLEAAEYGHSDTVKRLLTAAKDVKTQPLKDHLASETNANVVYLAARLGNISTLKVLHDLGVDITHMSEDGGDPLQLAAKAGSLDAVSFLLSTSEEEAGENLKSSISRSLCIAAEQGHLAIFEKLVDAGAIASLSDIHDCISSIVKRGHVHVLQRLVEELQKTGHTLDQEADPEPEPEVSPSGQSIKGPKQVLSINDSDHLTLRQALQQNLLKAVSSGHRDVVEYLLRFGPKGSLYEILKSAILIGNLDILRLLVENGGNLDQEPPWHSFSLLDTAISGKHVDITRYIVTQGVNFRLDSWGENSLHYVVGMGNPILLRQLLKSKNTNTGLQQLNGRGLTPLELAAARGSVDMVREFIRYAEAQSSGPTPRDQEPPPNVLCAAAESGSRELIELLVKSGWNPNAHGRQGLTPLQEAASHGHFEATKALLQAGAKPNAQSSSKGWTALHEVAKNGYLDIAGMLLDKRASPKIKESQGGKTPLHFAIEEDNSEMVKLLSKTKEVLNITDSEGQTPLHLAVEIGNVKMVQLLLELDGSEKVEDKVSDSGTTTSMREDTSIVTPLHLAAQSDDKLDIVKVLVLAGAKVNARNDKNEVPLQVAIRYSAVKVFTYLLSNKDVNINVYSPDETSVLEWAVRWDRVPEGLLSRVESVHLQKALHIALLMRKWSNLPPTENEASKRLGDSILEELAHRGGAVNAPGNPCFGTCTLLGRAVLTDSVHMATQLLRAGADASIPDETLVAPLHLAAAYSSSEMISEFLRKNYNVLLSDGCGRTALHWLALGGRRFDKLERLDLLIKLLPSEELPQCLNNVLPTAVACDDIKFVKGLLNQEVPDLDVNAPDRNGWTSVDIAAALGSDEVREMLEARGGKLGRAMDVKQMSPTKWNSFDRSGIIRLSKDGLTASVKGHPFGPKYFTAGTVRSDFCIPSSRDGPFYFEVKITEAGDQAWVAVGFCTENSPLEHMFLGWESESWGYHADIGAMHGNKVYSTELPTYGTGHIIGCEIDLRHGTAFFRKDGKRLGDRTFENIRGQIYPAVSFIIQSQDAEVSVKFDGPFNKGP